MCSEARSYVKACSLLAGLGDAHGWDGAGDVRVDVGGFAVMLGDEDWLLLGGRVLDSQEVVKAAGKVSF